jgi:serine/threonine-protein kinase
MDAHGQLSAALNGQYVIEREIGAGGMATVYLARDVRHERNVALKVLNPELGAVLGVERFLAEIKVTANLQHPNLLPLFDSGEAGGLLWYTMPHVDGESLRAKLTREKQIPVEEAVHIAIAVAGALEYAHSHGVIHRDLKPENILLQAGEPVVADFGIALAVSRAGGTRVTQTGLSLGTPQYMSPEQATGDRVIDGRSDIYSLAAVTYEMLTGEPPHAGATAQAIIAKLMTEEARPVTTLRRSVPAHIDVALARALQKLPADRFGSAREFSKALARRASRSLGSIGARASPGSRHDGRRGVALSVVGLSAVVALPAIGFVVGRRAATEPARAAAHFVLTYAPDEQLADLGGSPFAISPDGRMIAYRAGALGRNRLYVRPIDQLVARPLIGTEGAVNPAFSPDGRWVAFVAGGQLQKVPTAGGTVATLAEVGDVSGVSWSRSGALVTSNRAGNIVAVPETGGALRIVARPDTSRGERLLAWPLVLSDGATLLYTVLGRPGLPGAEIRAARLESDAATPLGISGTFPMGVVDGRLIYASATGVLMAIPFDERSLRTKGAPVPVISDVRVGTGGAAKAALSASGSLVVLAGRSSQQLVFGGAAPRTLTPDARAFSFPRLSPDGKRVAVTVSGSTVDVWVLDVGSGTLRRLTTEGVNERPEWTPDGSRVLFRSERGHGSELWSEPADGSQPARRLLRDAKDVREGVISPDGRWLLYRIDDPKTKADLWSVALDRNGVPEGEPRPFLATPFSEQAARFSPDGHWVAYESNESGEFSVYVRPFPGPGPVTQVSSDGGVEPVWSGDGRHLFYRDGARLIETSVSTTRGFVAGTQRVVYDVEFASDAVHANYDVSADGSRYLIPAAAAGNNNTIVVHDWKYELRASLAGVR